MSTTKTAVPMYIILSGSETNQGMIISKGENGVDNITQLDDDNWYIL